MKAGLFAFCLIFTIVFGVLTANSKYRSIEFGILLFLTVAFAIGAIVFAVSNSESTTTSPETTSPETTSPATQQFLPRILNDNLNAPSASVQMMAKTHTGVARAAETGNVIEPSDATAIQLINKVTNVLCGRNSVVQSSEQLRVLPGDAFQKLFMELYVRIDDSNRAEYEDLIASCIIQMMFLGMRTNKREDPNYKELVTGFDGKNVIFDINVLNSLNATNEDNLNFKNKIISFGGKVPTEDVKKIFIEWSLALAQLKGANLDQIKQKLNEVPVCSIPDL